jgi:excisionase family DNA binding protein
MLYQTAADIDSRPTTDITFSRPASAPTDDPWMTITESAQYIRVSTATAYRNVKAGLWRAARVGRGAKLIRIRKSWLDAAMEK